MEKKTLAQYLDFANHHPDSTPADIKYLCEEVSRYGFNSAFVNPCFVGLARNFLKEKGKVGAVVSFPLGQETLAIKLASAQKAIEDGADELDISLNIGLFKSGQWQKALEEMRQIVEAVKAQRKEEIVKLIIETGLLTEEEIKKASQLVLASGADFIKTCSGFGPRGATLKDVELIKSVVGEEIKIKVAGGIDTYQVAVDFIQAGAERIGTSHAPEIVK